MAGNRRNMIFGALAGAVLVGILAGLLGALIRDLAGPVTLIGFTLVGAVLGAYATGIVVYEREHEGPEPSAAYREGVLAEPAAEPGEPGLGPRLGTGESQEQPVG